MEVFKFKLHIWARTINL